MTGDQLDLTKWLQQLTTHAWADQTRRVEWYTDVMQRVARGELDAEHVRDEFMRFAGEETVSYARDVAQLGLHYYASLLDLGRSYNDRFYDRVFRTRPEQGGPRGSKQDTGPRQVTMDLRGEVGGEATAAFVIENKRNATAEISFIVSDFVDMTSGSAFRPPLELQPPWLTLDPHEEAEVRLRLALLDELFTPGRQYRTHVVVSGHDDLELIINVSVEPTAEPATRVSVVASPKVSTPEDAVAPKARARTKKPTSKSAPRKRKTARPSRGARKRPDSDKPRS